MRFVPNLPLQETAYNWHDWTAKPYLEWHGVKASLPTETPSSAFIFWLPHITLELSGPRQRVRLNDLLCEPLLLTLNLCFGLFYTELAEHHCPVCTMPTTDFEANQSFAFLNAKKNQPSLATDKLKLSPI